MTDPITKPPFWELNDLPKPGTHISREAFDALPTTAFQVEWHDGTIIYPNWNEDTMSPSPSSRHQKLVVRLVNRLSAWIPDGEVLTAPMDLRLDTFTVQPDVFWVAADSPCVDLDSHYAGPPDLVIEVLSTSNTENDRVTKFDLYQRSGVREYWIVNPVEHYLEVYSLQDGRYTRIGAYKIGQQFTSPVLQRDIAVDDLF